MNALEQTRNKCGLTQEKLSNMAGIAVSTYSQYETGARNIPLNKAEIIANILNSKIEDIFLPTKFTVSKNNLFKREEVEQNVSE